jgi:hypothetical protein
MQTRTENQITKLYENKELVELQKLKCGRKLHLIRKIKAPIIDKIYAEINITL